MTDSQARRLGELIGKARSAHGYSYEALADLSGFNHAWLYKLEQGRMNQPAPDRLARLAELLDIDPVRIDRITKDHLADSLPSTRVYFRSREKLSPAALDELDLAVEAIRQKYGTSTRSEDTEGATR